MFKIALFLEKTAKKHCLFLLIIVKKFMNFLVLYLIYQIVQTTKTVLPANLDFLKSYQLFPFVPENLPYQTLVYQYMH